MMSTWYERMRRVAARAFLVGLVIAGAAILMAIATAIAAAMPSAAMNQGPAANALGLRPATIIYSGNGAAFLAGRGPSVRDHGGLHWTAWTASAASGSGSDWHDNCEPSCAQGTYSPYPATVELSRPRFLEGHLVYTQMTVTYLGRRPPYPAYRSGSWTATLRYSSAYGTSYSWST